MYPLTYLLLHIILIFLTGIIAYISSIFAGLPIVLFVWLWFNLFIALYEFYIVYNRKRFADMTCPKNFWQEEVEVESDFLFRGWLEYTCYSDTRYLDPHDPVFFVEALNGIIVILMLIAALFGAYNTVIYLLILQAANCIFYFISLYKSEKTNWMYPYKTTGYLLMSSLWVFVPLYIIFSV